MDRIASKANLMRRGMVLADGGLCSCCRAFLETTHHLFLHCSGTWVLWNKVLKREGILWCVPGTFSALMMEWKDLAIKTDKVIWSLIPFAMCWSIWKLQNDVIFNAKVFCVETIWDMHMVRLFWWLKGWWQDCPYSLEQFNMRLERVQCTKKKEKARIVVPWCSPLLSYVKFNVDGASKGNPGTSGIGGVLRNHQGTMLGYFVKATGHLWAYEAELQAIVHALVFCQQYGIHNVLIESDCSLVVGWVRNVNARPWSLHQVFNRIDFLMPLVNCLGVCHILREGNSFADYLANQGCCIHDTIWVLCDSL